MAFLPEIGTYLAANVTNVSLTLGTNLFLGRLPETPDTCVAGAIDPITPSFKY